MSNIFGNNNSAIESQNNKQNNSTGNHINMNISFMKSPEYLSENSAHIYPKEMKITAWVLFFISILFSVLFA